MTLLTPSALLALWIAMTCGRAAQISMQVLIIAKKWETNSQSLTTL
jgi:hypothetical protein